MFWQHGNRIKAESRWGFTNRLIKKWLRNRNELLVVYERLLDTPIEERDTKTEFLKYFCENLMDYTAEGEFKVFVKLAKAYKTCQQEQLDPMSYRTIVTTTNKFVDFNDKYCRLFSSNAIEDDGNVVMVDPNTTEEPLTYLQLFDSLTLDLSNIGEQLADRLDAEDELVKTYLELTAQKKKDRSTSHRPLTF